MTHWQYRDVAILDGYLRNGSPQRVVIIELFKTLNQAFVEDIDTGDKFYVTLSQLTCDPVLTLKHTSSWRAAGGRAEL